VKINVIGPRGAAKSTLGTLAWPLRAALEGREPYIWIVSDTREQARAHLEHLKHELVENRRLARRYPRACGQGPVWRSGSIVLPNGAMIEAFGAGQRLRGRRRHEHRPTLIVCDDLQNDQHVESATQRARSRAWFHGMLMKAGTPKTNVLNLATALHREALAMELDRTPGWTSRIFRAIESWPTNMALWEAWEAIYTEVRTGAPPASFNPEPAATAGIAMEPRRAVAAGSGSNEGRSTAPSVEAVQVVGSARGTEVPHNEHTSPAQLARAYYDAHRAEMDEGAVLLWPEFEDLYTLMCMRAEGGRTAFAREKQGSPISPELCEWPETYFGPQIWFDDWPKRLRVKTLALDPSKGHGSRHGDYSAYVVLGIDEGGVLHVEADMARRATPQMVADGVELYRRHRPDGFGVESNQFQELLAESFELEFRRQGVLGVRPWLLDNRVNKRVRIRRLGPHVAAGRMRFKRSSPSTQLLVNQLKDFPIGDHDDGPDALEMALRLAATLLDGAQPVDNLGSRLRLRVE
jgi:predicted phage terminase large subunit-like protein